MEVSISLDRSQSGRINTPGAELKSVQVTSLEPGTFAHVVGVDATGIVVQFFRRDGRSARTIPRRVGAVWGVA